MSLSEDQCVMYTECSASDEGAMSNRGIVDDSTKLESALEVPHEVRLLTPPIALFSDIVVY